MQEKPNTNNKRPGRHKSTKIKINLETTRKKIGK